MANKVYNNPLPFEIIYLKEINSATFDITYSPYKGNVSNYLQL